MDEKRDTNSFKVSPKLLGYLIALLLGGAGGAGVDALRKPETGSFPTSQFVTREEALRNQGEIRERLVKIEAKLDQLTQEAEASKRRR